MGIEWRRNRGKKVLSRWSLVKRLSKKAVGAFIPFLFEMTGYLFGMFIYVFNRVMPFAHYDLNNVRTIFTFASIVFFVAIAYDSLLSLVANWWLAEHALPDGVYDWARDEIKEKLSRAEDSEPFNLIGDDNEET
jgi:hypothetical protein